MKGISVFALAIVLAAAPVMGLAQEPTKESVRVSVKAKGDDVRSVLGSIFEQAKKDYVLPVNFRFALFLSLEDQPFEKALDIVCKQTGLVATLEEGIYQVRVAPKPKPTPAPPIEKVEPAPEAHAKTEKKPEVAPKHEVEPPVTELKTTPLPKSVLAKRLTTRMGKAELRLVFQEISAQTKVPIEVAEDVPSYRVDAFLIKTSLKYALDNLTKATRLTYRFTDHGTIEVYKPTTESLNTAKAIGH